jgi:hypothetical protein
MASTVSTWARKSVEIPPLWEDLMTYDFNNPSGALAAYQLALHTFLLLEKNGTITTAQANEIIELALLALETLQQKATEDSRQTVEGARALLEALRTRRDRPSPSQSPSR